MNGREAARRLRELDGVRQLLMRAAREACAFGDALAASPPTDDEVTRHRRALLLQLARATADGVADALEAINEMTDELARPVPDADRSDA